MSSVSLSGSSAAPQSAPPPTAANADLGVNAASTQTAPNQPAPPSGSTGQPPSVTPAPGPNQGQNVDTYA